MSIAKQQNAVLDEAKDVFAKMLSEKVDAIDEASTTMMEGAISHAFKTTVQHIQDEYGYAIAFYIANDFQNRINADPHSPVKFHVSFEYTSGPAENPFYS